MASDTDGDAPRTPVLATAPSLVHSTPHRAVGSSSSTSAAGIGGVAQPRSPSFCQSPLNGSRPSPGRRRRRSLGRLEESPRARLAAMAAEVQPATTASSSDRGDDELRWLQNTITETKQRCHDHEKDISALQTEIELRTQKWDELLSQMRDADDRAYVLSEQLLTTISTLQESNAPQIVSAEETTRKVAARIDRSKATVENAWISLEASKKEIAGLEKRLAQEEAMLAKTDVASDMMFWLSIVFVALIAILVGLRQTGFL